MMGGMVLYGLVLVYSNKTIVVWKTPFTSYDLVLFIASLVAFITSVILETRTLKIESVVQKLLIVFNESENRREKVLKSSLRFYYKIKIWQWGMVEAICIMGFIASYISEKIYPYIICLLISEILILIFRPKIDHFLESVQRELLT